MRMASMILRLQELNVNAHLVLPPWGPLPHWQLSEENMNLPWSVFFDMKSLKDTVPVLEFEEFGRNYVDLTIEIDYFEDMFSTSDFSERHEWQNDCVADNDTAVWTSYGEIMSRETKCLLLEGTSETLATVLKQLLPHYSSILLSGAEMVLHSNYGSAQFWKIRKAMKINSSLVQRGDQFIRNFIGVEEIDSNCSYIAIHWRRRDFAESRVKQVPDFECIAIQIKMIQQITSAMCKRDVKIFLASDASALEIEQLKKLPSIDVFMFRDASLRDGERAIIDQWICSNAALFVGTYGSTFSFRIQEERELLGFSPNTTFNALCGDCGSKFSNQPTTVKDVICSQESMWRYRSVD